MHRLKCFAGVVSGNTFCFNIIKEMLDKVHLGEVPGVLLIILLILNDQSQLCSFEGRMSNLRVLVSKTLSPSSGRA